MEMDIHFYFIIGISFIAVLASVLLILKVNGIRKLTAEHNALKEKYKDVINIDQVLDEKNSNLTNLKLSIEEFEKAQQEKELKLNSEYLEKKGIFDRLLHELAIIEEDYELKSFGLYSPHYDFDTSEKFKAELDGLNEKEKILIKEGNAVICSSEWTVNGSRVEGRKQTNQYIKLMLRAFNNECESARLKVRWNNISRMEERISKACEAINKLGTVHNINITHEYLEMKLAELRLTYEYQEKKQEEKELERKRREEAREEEKVQEEIQKELAAVNKEEEKYQKALENARKEIASAKEEEIGELNKAIQELQAKLAEVGERRERAISRAQLTKSGYVYVISNLGSFGENVYKIGMTRRLDPMDRVRELGDASVPFRFDVHAMVYSENAPELETRLHKAFDSKRVNMVNNRKEFYTVSLDEVKDEVLKINSDVEFIHLAEAREYRETVAILNPPGLLEEELQKGYDFPESLI